jgi:hypothetical protein
MVHIEAFKRIDPQSTALQDIILQIPRGVSRLMDLLNDTREVIRNDTILLLNNLTKTTFESLLNRVSIAL